MENKFFFASYNSNLAIVKKSVPLLRKQTTMRTKLAGKLDGIKARIWFLVVLCASLCLGYFTVLSAPPYPLAIACSNNINLNGNNITVDSFDSSDPDYSDWNTNWGYGTYDPAKAMAHANVGTDSSSLDAINVGNADIYGTVNTGPGGTIGIGVNGYVGPYPAGTGITPGYANDTMNVTFPDVALPAGAAGWASVPANCVITASGNYYSAGISSNLNIAAPYVTIYVNGSISITNNNSITIRTNVVNASLYVVGPSLKVSGTPVSYPTQRASVLSIYGLPTLTSIGINSTNMAATIYAPEADLSMGGGGPYLHDFVGAIVVRSVTFSGNSAFHFDEYLARYMPFGISVQPTNCAVKPGTNVTFWVSLDGDYPQGYQWFFNQTNLLAGATNSTFTLTNVQFSDAGAYSIVATNWSGSVTSALASLIVYTNAAATLTPPILLTNGLQFSITGVTGLNYIVQSSTNLADWVSLATNQTPFTFLDTNAPGFPQQFYRVICFP